MPLFPVMLTLAFPVFVPGLTESVAVDVPGLPGETFTLLGLKPMLAPLGKPFAVRATLPAKPLDDVIVKSVVPVGFVDRLTVTVAGLTVMEMFPPRLTVRFTLVEWLRLPLVPVTVMA